MLTIYLAASIASASLETCPAYPAINEPIGQFEALTKTLKDNVKANDGRENTIALVKHYRTLGEYKVGLKLIEPLLLEMPDDRELQRLRTQMALQRVNNASLFGKLGAAKKMRKSCEADLELDPTNSTAKLCLARFFGIAPGIAGGSKDRRDAILADLKETDLSTYYFAGVTSGSITDAAEQVDAMVKATQEDNSPDKRLQLAAAYIAHEDWDNAHTILSNLALDETDETISRLALYQIGRTAARSNTHLDAGLDALTKFLAGPTWVSGTNFRSRAHVEMSNIYARLNCTEGRARALERAVDTDPKNKDAKKALKAIKRS